MRWSKFIELRVSEIHIYYLLLKWECWIIMTHDTILCTQIWHKHCSCRKLEDKVFCLTKLSFLFVSKMAKISLCMYLCKIKCVRISFLIRECVTSNNILFFFTHIIILIIIGMRSISNTHILIHSLLLKWKCWIVC
jgi:hypothetical protein